MRLALTAIILLFLCCKSYSFSNRTVEATRVLEGDFTTFEKGKPNPVWFSFFKKRNQRKKIIASALAFPLPFGVLGIHRIYLGTKPYVPLVYIATLGGCAGILPLIDFFTLLTNKDISRFQCNTSIFMWVDNENPPAGKAGKK